MHYDNTRTRKYMTESETVLKQHYFLFIWYLSYCDE